MPARTCSGSSSSSKWTDGTSDASSGALTPDIDLRLAKRIPGFHPSPDPLDDAVGDLGAFRLVQNLVLEALQHVELLVPRTRPAYQLRAARRRDERVVPAVQDEERKPKLLPV